MQRLEHSLESAGSTVKGKEKEGDTAVVATMKA
jgi:hypothetical protein